MPASASPFWPTSISDDERDARTNRARVKALKADRCLTYGEHALLTADERSAYWAKFSPPRSIAPIPRGTIHFDFTEERHDRLFADTAENVAYGE